MKEWRCDFKDAEFVFSDGEKKIFKCDSVVEKMSKSKFNVVNPDDVVEKYGADVLRMYLMFLGPIQDSKPWNTKGIEGISRFLKKVGALKTKISERVAEKNELKIINKTIKKVGEDIENYSFNTAISAMMICVNELSKCEFVNNETWMNFLSLLYPFAPSFVEKECNKDRLILKWSEYDEKYLVDDSFECPVMINGKLRAKIKIVVDESEENVKKLALENEIVKKWVGDKLIKKIVVVKNKVVNIVL